MKEVRRDFLVGIVSILALVGLAGMLMQFGELEWLFASRYRLTIHTDSAAGLRPGSRIELSGVRIGVLHEVFIRPDPEDPAYPVELIALIDEGTVIPRNVVPRASQGQKR